MRLLGLFKFLAVRMILHPHCTQGTPVPPYVGGKEIDFENDLKVEFALIGPNGQNMDVNDLLWDHFDGQIFEAELQFDGMELP